MMDRIERTLMRRGRKADAGFGTMDLIIWLAVVALIVGTGVGLYFILIGNANENKGQDAGLAAHNAIQSYYSDYGTLPGDADAVDTYLTNSGDIEASNGAPNGTTITVYKDSTPGLPTNATETVVTSTEFSDVIVIDRSGKVTKYPTYTTGATVVIAQWVKASDGSVTTS